jgi:hypothetical protein
VTHRMSFVAGLLGLLLILVGCGGDEANDPTPSVEAGQPGGVNVLRPMTTGQEVQSPDGRYSLRVPGEWVEYDDPVAELAYRTIADDPALALNVVRDPELGESPRVQVYAEEGRERIARIYRNVNSLSLSPVRVGTIEAYRWIFTATVGERERLMYQLYVVEGGQGFVLTGSAPINTDLDVLSSTFDGIAGSLTFARG